MENFELVSDEWPEQRENNLTPRQEEILDQLEGIILRNGFRSLRLSDLTAELHCSRNILYALAPSKDELALLVIERYMARLRVELSCAFEKAETARDRIALALDALSLRAGLVSRRFYEDVAQYAPAREVQVRHRKLVVSQLREIIASGIEEGAFNRIDALFAAEVIQMLVISIADGRLVGRTGLSSAEAAAEFKRLIFDGLIAN